MYALNVSPAAGRICPACPSPSDAVAQEPPPWGGGGLDRLRGRCVREPPEPRSPEAAGLMRAGRAHPGYLWVAQLMHAPPEAASWLFRGTLWESTNCI